MGGRPILVHTLIRGATAWNDNGWDATTESGWSDQAWSGYQAWSGADNAVQVYTPVSGDPPSANPRYHMGIMCTAAYAHVYIYLCSLYGYLHLYIAHVSL